MRARIETEREALLAEHALSEEESSEVSTADIGLLYLLAVNGQILKHYASLRCFTWAEYLDAMRQGLRDHGPVSA